ncbi:MAG TPA: HAMP domain-containing sensor histidine kinase [Candidatus Udaeobacter sp.]|nr:HAMP domain-containing sensor histidine kinase [Candidatus Udaeobacter sp.]
MNMVRPPRLRTLAAAITVVSVLVALIAIAVIAAGVLIVAQSTFDRLMVQAGAPASQAQTMFDHGIVEIFIAAVVIAIAVSVVAAVVLSVILARPLRDMAGAARRIAAGDYDTRVPRAGPEEVASLADSFNQMAISLAEQERERREFIANAAHELRTPLTNLQGYLEALRDGVIAPTPEQFGSLHEEAQRLVRLSRSLDVLSDHDHRRASEEVELRGAVTSAFEVTRPAFDARRISVELDVPSDLRVRAEPDGLAQVLGNLLQNASRYTPEGGRASIRAEGRRSWVTVSIDNSGDGIPAADLPHVFDRFYRVEKSRDAARGGAGIGLAIVKQLVEAAGGHVGVESAGRSTRFWFTLPAA